MLNVTLEQEFGLLLITIIKPMSYAKANELATEIALFHNLINPFLYVEN